MSLFRFCSGLLLCSLASTVWAKDVEVVSVELESSAQNWTIHVTLRHNDQGYEHYVDAWRIVDDKNRVITQVGIYHPHNKSETFVVSKTNVAIPKGTRIVIVEASAKPHGWSKKRVKIDLQKKQGERYRIRTPGEKG